MRLLVLKRPYRCARCDSEQPVGAKTYWRVHERVVVCVPCHDDKPKASPIAAIQYMRTDAERSGHRLSWTRSDDHFVAIGGLPGSHMLATDGEWVFDFNGTTSEADLIAANRVACEQGWPGWVCSLVDVTDAGVDAFGTNRAHRPPRDLAGDVRARADLFIDRLGVGPSLSGVDTTADSARSTCSS